MIQLTMRDGGPEDDPDAEKYGYWTVTGPQPEEEVCGTIERARDFTTGNVFFPWYLARRSSTVRNSTNTYMVTIADGMAPSKDEALAELQIAWLREVGESVAAMPLVEPPPLEVPWRDV